jgi:2-oxoisovalerate dehydrogenase E1 component alpha subunit
MVLARLLDERLWALNRPGKVPLVASCQGAEAASLGSGWAGLKDGDCFFFPYYRDMPFKLLAGVTPLQIMLGALGKAGAPFNGGRQFLLQGASLEHRMIHISNVVGSSLTQATGYALGCKTLEEKTVVLAAFGDGASSEGEWHEAMNFASIHRLPIVFLCYNNRLAISVPQKKQMAIENLADRAAGYNIPGLVVDGTNLLEVYRRTQEAIERARSVPGGPTLLELKVERLKPHTSDDDDRKYRSPQELERARSKDPLPRFRSYLLDTGLLTLEKDEELRSKAEHEVDWATEAKDGEPWPDPSTLHDHIYAP